MDQEIKCVYIQQSECFYEKNNILWSRTFIASFSQRIFSSLKSQGKHVCLLAYRSFSHALDQLLKVIHRELCRREREMKQFCMEKGLENGILVFCVVGKVKSKSHISYQKPKIHQLRVNIIFKITKQDIFLLRLSIFILFSLLYVRLSQSQSYVLKVPSIPLKYLYTKTTIEPFSRNFAVKMNFYVL